MFLLKTLLDNLAFLKEISVFIILEDYLMQTHKSTICKVEILKDCLLFIHNYEDEAFSLYIWKLIIQTNAYC